MIYTPVNDPVNNFGKSNKLQAPVKGNGGGKEKHAYL
jgi:hypothetical protein